MTTMENKFEQFHAEHPEVYAEFVRYAKNIRARGFRRYSSQTITAVMRFHSDVDGRPEDKFKVNQNYHPYMARKLMREDPSFEGFFETRTLRAA